MLLTWVQWTLESGAPPGVPWQVLSSVGVTYTVSEYALSSAGTTYTMPNAVLSSAGVSYTPV